MADRKKTCWFLAVLTALVMIPFLGETIYFTKGEPREAIVAVTMLQSGNWILPVSYGADMAFKPPFLAWLIAAVSSITGEVSEFTSRLPSTLAFLAMQLFFFCFMAKRKGVQTALLAALLLLTSFEVHRAAIACRVDMVQVSCIVISLCLLFQWDEKGARRLPWLAIVLMACASLTKGPVGSIFPCLVIGVYQLMRGKNFWKAFWPLVGIGTLSIVPLLGWYVAAYFQGGEEFFALMMEENFGRFLGKMSYPSHENPVWYNFMTIIAGWVPWTLVLLLSLFDLNWKQMRILPEGSKWSERLKKGWTAFRNQSPLQLFIWLSILVIFIFYCIPKSKRSVYLLPIYPFMAILMAEYLLALVQRGARVFKISAILFAVIPILVTAVFCAVRLGLLPDSIWGSGRHAAENIAFMHALETTPFSFSKWLLLLVPLGGAASLLYMLRKKQPAFHLLHVIAFTILSLFVALYGVYQPTILPVKSDKKLAEYLSAQIPEGPIYSYSDWTIRFYCVNYYLDDRMRNFDIEKPEGEGHLIVAARHLDEFLALYGEKYDLKEVYRTPYRSCDLRSEVLMFSFAKKE